MMRTNVCNVGRIIGELRGDFTCRGVRSHAARGRGPDDERETPGLRFRASGTGRFAALPIACSQKFSDPGSTMASERESPIRVLVIEDDRVLLGVMEQWLVAEGFDVRRAESYSGALASLAD